MENKPDNYIKRPKYNFFSGIVFGLILGGAVGFTLALLIDKQLSILIEISLLLLGAILGVAMEAVIKYLHEYWEKIKSLTPLRSILGSVHTDETWIYIHPMGRNIFKSPLHRITSNQQAASSIIGSPTMFGEGDAFALGLLLQVLEKAGVNEKVNIEEAQHAIGKWGRSAICIGAHNSKTEEVIEKFNNPYFKFVDNKRFIVKPNTEYKVGDKEFVKAVRMKGNQSSSTIDYGIILKLRDETHCPDVKTIIVIAGLGDNGTAGAAYFLLKHYSKLPNELDTFGALIQVPSGYQSAGDVEFEDVAKTIRKRW